VRTLDDVADGFEENAQAVRLVQDPPGAWKHLEIGVLAANLDPRGSGPGLDGWFLAATGSLDDDDLPVIRLPAPADFATGGAAECSASCAGSRGYTWCGAGNPVGPGCNPMLDVVVSGCAVSPHLCILLLNPTQPDVGTSGQPPVALGADPTTGKVTVIEPDDAYSDWLEFASERVHPTNRLGGIFADGFESGSFGGRSFSQPNSESVMRFRREGGEAPMGGGSARLGRRRPTVCMLSSPRRASTPRADAPSAAADGA